MKHLLRRVKYGEPIVVVSGLPRSGTSMMMQMLHAGGMPVFSDGEREADEHNPKGYYELERVKTLDKPGDKNWMEEGKGKAVKVISFLLRNLPPKFSYQVVFLVRNVEEIIASQNKMLRSRGEKVDEANDERAADLFQKHWHKVKVQMARADNIEIIYVPYRDVIKKPKEQAEKINQFLGNRLDVIKMTGVVDGTLYRNRA